LSYNLINPLFFTACKLRPPGMGTEATELSIPSIYFQI